MLLCPDSSQGSWLHPGLTTDLMILGSAPCSRSGRPTLLLVSLPSPPPDFFLSPCPRWPCQVTGACGPFSTFQAPPEPFLPARAPGLLPAFSVLPKCTLWHGPGPFPSKMGRCDGIPLGRQVHCLRKHTGLSIFTLSHPRTDKDKQESQIWGSE